MDLEIAMSNEYGDPTKGSYSGVDFIIKDRETGRHMGNIQGIKIDVDTEEITLTANMCVLLSGLHVRDCSGKGFMCTVRYTDTEEIDECLIKMHCLSVEERNPGLSSSGEGKYTRCYYSPAATDLTFFHAESGRKITNVTRFMIEAAIDDIVIQPEITILGSRIMLADRD